MKLILEMEIGITGGVEDGVDNSGVDNSGVSCDKLFSTKEDVFMVHQSMSPMFTIAAAFGNVHGVCKPGTELFDSFQQFFEAKLGNHVQKLVFFVFHAVGYLGGQPASKRDHSECDDRRRDGSGSGRHGCSFMMR